MFVFQAMLAKIAFVGIKTVVSEILEFFHSWKWKFQCHTKHYIGDKFF